MRLHKVRKLKIKNKIKFGKNVELTQVNIENVKANDVYQRILEQGSKVVRNPLDLAKKSIRVGIFKQTCQH